MFLHDTRKETKQENHDSIESLEDLSPNFYKVDGDWKIKLNRSMFKIQHAGFHIMIVLTLL